MVEAGLWIAFAIFAYIYTFEFDKDIETYRFNATGWPRGVLLCIVLAALAHVYQVYRDRSTAAGRDAFDAQEADEEEGPRQYWRLFAMLGLPVVYAFLLEPIGFYALTPVFILLFLILAEERRWPYLIGISLGLYAILVFVFGKLLYLSLPVGNVQIFYDFSNWILTVIR
jgi:hypothetical protein